MEFDEWLDATRDAVVSEDRIDPQLFLEWKRSLEGQARRPARRRRLDAQLDGTNGERGQYSVIPVVSDESIHWIDAAGFLLARSQADDFPFQGLVFRDDFELRTDREQPVVRRTFSGLR